MTQALLYHTTSISNAFLILRGNCLNPSETYNGISFSRNKQENYGCIQFILNRQSLSYNYKITPHMDEAERVTGTDSSEEVILRPVNNILRYLVGIDITDARSLRILLKKLDKMTKYQLVNNITERNTIKINHLYNLYMVVKTLGIPVGERLAYLFQTIETKLSS